MAHMVAGRHAKFGGLDDLTSYLTPELVLQVPGQGWLATV
jgi:hypothetical protein